MSLLNLPTYIKVECTQIVSGTPSYFEASVWDTGTYHEKFCLAIGGGSTRLAAVREAVQTYWTWRIASAQLLTESLR